MAKREINRQVEETEPVPVTGQAVEEVALPAEKQARPKEVKPLDVTIAVKAPGVFVMRMWSGAVLFAGQGKMNKIPISRGKPINIRITQ